MSSKKGEGFRPRLSTEPDAILCETHINVILLGNVKHFLNVLLVVQEVGGRTLLDWVMYCQANYLLVFRVPECMNILDFLD
jgi:hypothetical protein